MSLVDGDGRPIRKGSLAKPTQFGYTAQVTDNRQGIVVDFELEAGMPPDAPRLGAAIERAIAAVDVVPDAVTADRGYGQASVDDELEALGVDLVAVLCKGKTTQKRQVVEAAPSFVELVKWRTGSEGRIAALKRQHGMDRARIRGLVGARTWCGWGVLCHNAIKISARPHDLTRRSTTSPTGQGRLLRRARAPTHGRTIDVDGRQPIYFFRTK